MKRRTRLLSFVGIFALVLGLIGANPVFAQDATPQAQARNSDPAEVTLGDRLCPVTGPVGETEGETYFCGLIYVPEDYTNPESRQIQLTYAVLKSKSLAPLPDPVVYLEGGPGGSAIEGLSAYAKVFEGLRQDRDIIIFDQRGTKYSTRLDCDPFLLMLNYLIATDPETQALYQDLLDSTSDTVMSGLVAEIYMGACAEGLGESGYDLTQYNSANSVKDLFALTNALGYDQVNLYGISYGTRLAMTAMRDHPDQIRSVVLDSTYPPQINNLENMSNLLDEVLVKLVATCKADAECNKAFPDFGKQLAAVITAFAEDPESLTGLETVLGLINQNPAVAEYLPLMIDEMANGKTDVLEAIINGDLPAEAPPEDLPGQQDDLVLEAQQLQETADQLFVQAALEAQESRPGAVWMKHVADAMKPLSEDENNLAAIALMVVVLQSPAPSPDLLEGFVREYLPADSQQDLLDELAGLSDLELQFVYDLINETSDKLAGGGSGLTDGMYFSVECNEEVPFNDLAVGQEIADNLTFPELAASGLAMADQVASICSIWPSGKADLIETKPIKSDIPTLIFSGAYDIQTPPSWNEMAMEGLTNATLVQVPASGHGVIIFSQCAANIAHSFVSSPETDLATGCTKDLEPDFVTPEELAAQTGESTPEPGPGTDETRPTGSRGD